jgi:hypothetical protein
VLAADPGLELSVSSGAAATRALPRDNAAFTGRERELAQLLDRIDGQAASGAVVGIHAIDGMAGIGKSTFAVHAAHQLAAGFPDGQYFLPLHGHTPGQRPVDPADALASLLLTAGLAPSRSRPGWRPARRDGGIIWPTRRSCCYWMTRSGMSSSGRCCRATVGAWC